MKRNILARMALVLGLTVIFATSPTIAAQARAATDTPTIARTKAWDGINNTLGGVPESVKKIQYKGSIFYLAPNVSDEDFAAVLAAGPEAVKLKPASKVDRLYTHPVYILWNSDKTVLLVHPITFDFDDILEDVAIPTVMPVTETAKLKTKVVTQKAMTTQEKQEYMLTAEYADEVRAEFYRLLNEHRVANGLKELEVNEELQKYADIRAAELRVKSGHTRPNGTAAGSGWYNSKNVMNTRYAENALSCGAIAADPKEAALGIFNIWKESKGHNRHMLYAFDSNITMAFGIEPRLGEKGFVTSGAIFATGY